MNTFQTQVLSCARRVRDFVAGLDVKRDPAELTVAWQELDESRAHLIGDASAQEAITMQSRVQTTELRRLRLAFRDGELQPIDRMNRMMKLEINGTEITSVLPSFGMNSERLATATDAMATALSLFGLQFVAKGLASNFVEALSKAKKVLRAATEGL